MTDTRFNNLHRSDGMHGYGQTGGRGKTTNAIPGWISSISSNIMYTVYMKHALMETTTIWLSGFGWGDPAANKANTTGRQTAAEIEIRAWSPARGRPASQPRVSIDITCMRVHDVPVAVSCQDNLFTHTACAAYTCGCYRAVCMGQARARMSLRGLLVPHRSGQVGRTAACPSFALRTRDAATAACDFSRPTRTPRRRGVALFTRGGSGIGVQ